MRICAKNLGDLILLAVMHAQIAEEAGRFNIGEVLEEVTAKLIRRHPHVFGESGVRDTDGVVKQWEAIKREEKNDAGGHYLADLPAALPALMRAQKAQKKAARVNFDWTEIADVVAKVDEELAEAKEAIASRESRARLRTRSAICFLPWSIWRAKANSMRKRRCKMRPTSSSRGLTGSRMSCGRKARSWARWGWRSWTRFGTRVKSERTKASDE